MLDTVVVYVVVMMRIRKPLINTSIHAQYVGIDRVIITISMQGFMPFVVTIRLTDKSRFAFFFKNLTRHEP